MRPASLRSALSLRVGPGARRSGSSDLSGCRRRDNRRRDSRVSRLWLRSRLSAARIQADIRRAQSAREESDQPPGASHPVVGGGTVPDFLIPAGEIRDSWAAAVAVAGRPEPAVALLLPSP